MFLPFRKNIWDGLGNKDPVFQCSFQMLCFSQILTQNRNGCAYALVYLCACLINEFQENLKSDLITCLQSQRANSIQKLF